MPASDSPDAGCHSLIRYRQSGTPAVQACCARPGGNAVHGTATAPEADTVPAAPAPTGRPDARPALPAPAIPAAAACRQWLRGRDWWPDSLARRQAREGTAGLPGTGPGTVGIGSSGFPFGFMNYTCKYEISSVKRNCFTPQLTGFQA